MVEARVGLTATPGGFIENRSIELRAYDIVGCSHIEGGIGAVREGLQFGLR